MLPKVSFSLKDAIATAGGFSTYSTLEMVEVKNYTSARQSTASKTFVAPVSSSTSNPSSIKPLATVLERDVPLSVKQTPQIVGKEAPLPVVVHDDMSLTENGVLAAGCASEGPNHQPTAGGDVVVQNGIDPGWTIVTTSVELQELRIAKELSNDGSQARREFEKPHAGIRDGSNAGCVIAVLMTPDVSDERSLPDGQKRLSLNDLPNRNEVWID